MYDVSIPVAELETEVDDTLESDTGDTLLTDTGDTLTEPLTGPLDFGDVVSLTWPADDLVSSQLAQIVGERFASSDSTITLTVLV